MAIETFDQRYLAIVAASVDNLDESLRMEAGRLGRDMVVANIPPEVVIEMHEKALRSVAQIYPDMPLSEAVNWIMGPLMELAVEYSLGLKEKEQARRVVEDSLRQAQKLESVGQLAAGVAHEVNNPLATILGFSKLLLGQDIPDQAKQDVQTIFDEAERGTTIIQDLLAFARKGTSEKKIVGIARGLQRVLNLKAADFRANRVKVSLDINEDLPNVKADEQRLQQVYLNLLTNAQHAMSAANDGGNIEIRCKQHDDVLRLSFIDDGPGMTKNVIEKIFDPFYTTKPVGVGTGLGLSVCYGIIEDHGGRLWAESEPGAGAVFFIELPWTEDAGAAEAGAGV